jgi:Fic family protein
MLDATRNFAAPLTEERLFGWHASLFQPGRKGTERITVGAWRREGPDPMQVVSGAMGRETVHLQAPVAGRLPSEMVRFLLWFNEPSGPDPVLRAAIAHLWFVTVHPFEDGNGRIARAIADMVLARADGALDRYYSMSSRIEAERKDYYEELQAAQQGSLDITRWLAWFLGCLDRAIEGADTALVGVLDKARVWQRLHPHSVNERQRRVLNHRLDGL